MNKIVKKFVEIMALVCTGYGAYCLVTKINITISKSVIALGGVFLGACLNHFFVTKREKQKEKAKQIEEETFEVNYLLSTILAIKSNLIFVENAVKRDIENKDDKSHVPQYVSSDGIEFIYGKRNFAFLIKKETKLFELMIDIKNIIGRLNSLLKNRCEIFEDFKNFYIEKLGLPLAISQTKKLTCVNSNNLNLFLGTLERKLYKLMQEMEKLFDLNNEAKFPLWKRLKQIKSDMGDNISKNRHSNEKKNGK
jgi:hypothetical protein